MSIGLSFTGRIDSPKALLEAAQTLARERDCHLKVGETGLKAVLCPMGGELGILWRPAEDPAGPWLVRGAAYRLRQGRGCTGRRWSCWTACPSGA